MLSASPKPEQKETTNRIEADSAFFVIYLMFSHYENTPIQLYRTFHLQKLKIFG